MSLLWEKTSFASSSLCSLQIWMGRLLLPFRSAGAGREYSHQTAGQLLLTGIQSVSPHSVPYCSKLALTRSPGNRTNWNKKNELRNWDLIWVLRSGDGSRVLYHLLEISQGKMMKRSLWNSLLSCLVWYANFERRHLEKTLGTNSRPAVPLKLPTSEWFLKSSTVLTLWNQS